MNKIVFSAQTSGFYDPAIHGANIPADAVEITRDEHVALMAGQSAGQVIAADADGRPVLQDPPVREITGRDVDRERNRRLFSTFEFQGKMYDCDEDSLARISGAATLAGFAVVFGAQAGDLMWHEGAEPFVWIAADNSTTEMDAPTMFAFGKAAANYQSSLIFASRKIKDLSEIPADFKSDGRWPK